MFHLYEVLGAWDFFVSGFTFLSYVIHSLHKRLWRFLTPTAPQQGGFSSSFGLCLTQIIPTVKFKLWEDILAQAEIGLFQLIKTSVESVPKGKLLQRQVYTQGEILWVLA